MKSNKLNPNKKLIIETAEKLFAEQGFAATNIADISAIVGVGDSTIYEHFENKEDILFAIPQQKTQELIDRNADHLRGLVGVEVKLRKLVWNYIEFLLKNKAYATLILFELRPNRRFYLNENYKLLRQFIHAYKEVIIEGQQSGKFISDISPTLFVKLIMGIVDHILVTYYIENRPADPMAHFEEMIDLLMSAITKKSKPAKSRDKRIKILNAAAGIFSNVGFQKARIQDIAKAAGVGDATIYQYFKNKEDILFSMSTENTNNMIAVYNDRLNGISDISDKIRVMIQDYLHYMNNNKEYASICVFELRYNRDFYKTEGYQLFKQFSRYYYDAITDGINQKIFKESINPYIATKMIFGVIDHIILTWIVFGNPQSPIIHSDAIGNLIVNALIP